jgi:hypothetical protein
MLLVQSILEEEKEKYDIIRTGLQALSFGTMGAMGGTVSGASGQEKINMEFERHHKSVELTGKMDVSPTLRKALDAVYHRQKNPDETMHITGPIDDPVLGD